MVLGVFYRAPPERQVQPFRIVFKSFKERPTLGAESDLHTVGNKIPLDHH